MLFNRCMLPSYYGLLRLCCVHSRHFTRQLAQHQNIQWAFKNITPYPSQYSAVSIPLSFTVWWVHPHPSVHCSEYTPNPSQYIAVSTPPTLYSAESTNCRTSLSQSCNLCQF